MAAIDKIYGTKAQYKKFHAWIEKNHPAWLVHFYPFPTHRMAKGAVSAITNFPVDVDRYLLNNCPLDFVVKEIKEQYRIE
jgi:hypothetical protein